LEKEKMISMKKKSSSWNHHFSNNFLQWDLFRKGDFLDLQCVKHQILVKKYPISPLRSLNPNSSQSSKVGLILLVKQDYIIIEGENEIVQQQNSHMFRRTCCTPSPKPTTSLRREVRQRRPPSRLIETIEGNLCLQGNLKDYSLKLFQENH